MELLDQEDLGVQSCHEEWYHEDGENNSHYDDSPSVKSRIHRIWSDSWWRRQSADEVCRRVHRHNVQAQPRFRQRSKKPAVRRVYPRPLNSKTRSMTLVGKFLRLIDKTLPRGECQASLIAVVEVPNVCFHGIFPKQRRLSLGGSQSLEARRSGQGTVPRPLPRATQTSRGARSQRHKQPSEASLFGGP
jgi:hypothetical protein